MIEGLESLRKERLLTRPCSTSSQSASASETRAFLLKEDATGPETPGPYLGRMVKIGQFSGSRIVFDARYSPLLISTFFGKCDLEAARWHTDLINQSTTQAAKRGQRVITISDATHSDRPTAEARKFWADNMSTGSAAARAATLGTYVVFTSAVVRGALTAIGWLNPEVKKIQVFGTLPDAISAATRCLAKERLPAPQLDPKGYQLPHEESSHAASV